MTGNKPAVRPARPFFSSGPCAKRPGWTLEALDGALLGRSHRSKPGKAKLKDAIDRTREDPAHPGDYRIAIVPASDTGAVEMALWSLLGPRPSTCSPGKVSAKTGSPTRVKQLKLEDCAKFTADYGKLPDLAQRRSRPRHRVYLERHDIGRARAERRLDRRRPSGTDDLRRDERCVRACICRGPKLDVTTFSWQKVLGGEAAHGMLVLSPHAVARLESYTPPWPLPKIFRMTKGGKLVEGIFEGETINTPSMLAVEDYIDTLKWGEQHRRSRRADRPRRRQSRGADANGCAKSQWVGVPRRRRRDTFQHVGVPQDRRSLVRETRKRRRRPTPRRHSRA